MTNVSSNIENQSLRTLHKTQALMEMERSLSMSMERAEPWLAMGGGDGQRVGDATASIATSAGPPPSSSYGTFQSRVRPVPRTMKEVKLVLDVGRNYSTRTSAPAGWNPQAPLMGFASPNPLPSQLRSGALAALELQTAKDKLLEVSNRRLKKEQQQQRLKEEAEQEMEKKRQRGRGGDDDGDKNNKKKIRGGAQPMDVDNDSGAEEEDGQPLPPPNSGEAKRRPQHLKDDEQDDEQNQRQKPLARRVSGAATAGLAVKSAPPVDMNLSDSSSDDDDDESYDSD